MHVFAAYSLEFEELGNVSSLRVERTNMSARQTYVFRVPGSVFASPASGTEPRNHPLVVRRNLKPARERGGRSSEHVFTFQFGSGMRTSPATGSKSAAEQSRELSLLQFAGKTRDACPSKFDLQYTEHADANYQFIADAVLNNGIYHSIFFRDQHKD